MSIDVTQPPASLTASRLALVGLAKLLSATSEAHWNSMARPSAQELSALVWMISGKLDLATEDLGYEI